MQAMKFIFKRLSAIAVLAYLLAGCGEKTPEQLAAENKRALEISVKRAQVMMFEGDYAKAAELLEETSQKHGDDAALCEALAYSYAQIGRGAEAAIFFEKASDISGGSVQMLVNAAKAYEQAGQFQSAARAYEKYLKIKPRDMIAWKSLSGCHEKMSKYQDALNAYLEGVKKSGRNPDTREACDIGNLFLKVGNPVQGRRWLEAALAATSAENTRTRADILAGLVAAYLAQKEAAALEGAVAELDKIAPGFVGEKYPQLHEQLAEFRRKLKEAEDALKAAEFKKAEEAKKAEEEKRLAEEKKSAEEAAEKAKKEAESAGKPAAEPADPAEKTPKLENVEIRDELPEAKREEDKSPLEKLIEKTYALIAEKKPAEASKTGNLAVAEDRNSAAAWRALALAYDAEGRAFDSHMAAREAYVRNPDDINSTLLYIRTASGVQNNEQFLNTLYRANKKFPNNSEIMLGLARTYKLIGDRPNAKYFYNSFLNGTPKEHPLYEEVSEEFEEYVAAGEK